MLITFQLPPQAETIPLEKSSVHIGDPLFKISKENVHTFHVADELKIDPKQIFTYLSVGVGDNVTKGQKIASKKGFVRSKTITSPFDGKITRISHESGDVILEGGIGNDHHHVNSFFNGTIALIDVDKGLIQVDIPSGQELLVSNISTNGGGKMFYFLDDNAYFMVSETEIGEAHIVMEVVQPHVQTKFEALSADGFVTLNNMSEEGNAIIVGSKEAFEKLVKQKYTYIVYSTHDQKAIVYND